MGHGGVDVVYSVSFDSSAKELSKALPTRLLAVGERYHTLLDARWYNWIVGAPCRVSAHDRTPLSGVRAVYYTTHAICIVSHLTIITCGAALFRYCLRSSHGRPT